MMMHEFCYRLEMNRCLKLLAFIILAVQRYRISVLLAERPPHTPRSERASRMLTGLMLRMTDEQKKNRQTPNIT